jgi:DNA repair exonuclease SbcCD ATPase subunit
MEQAMRILRLEADNIKRVKAVDITPEGNVVVISGKNGAGKSSTIDAIWLALSYRAASKSNPYPLRAGEEKGHAGPLDLGDYIVTRTFTESGTSLKVTTPDGSTIRSPQKVLDGMIGDLAFDPWAFARLKNAEQRQMLGDLLFNLTEGEVNLAEFDSKRQQLYEERTELNREKRRLTGVLTSFRPPVDADPREEVSIADLSRSIADGIEINNRIQAIKESNQRAVSNTPA